jgi:hypothetical protein
MALPANFIDGQLFSDSCREFIDSFQIHDPQAGG